MITKLAIRCKFGHHNWGPILGGIEQARHECEECGAVKPITVKPRHATPLAPVAAARGRPSSKAENPGLLTAMDLLQKVLHSRWGEADPQAAGTVMP